MNDSNGEARGVSRRGFLTGTGAAAAAVTGFQAELAPAKQPPAGAAPAHGPAPVLVELTVNGKKVVVLSWPDGSKFQVANTGPAYPLRAKFKGGYPAWVVFSEYNVPFDVTAPSNAIDYRTAG